MKHIKQFTKEFFEETEKEGKMVEGTMFKHIKKDLYIEWLEKKLEQTDNTMISIKDKKPNKDEQVLVYVKSDPHDGFAIAIYDGKKFFEGGIYTGKEYTENVVLWQSLPEPIKE